MSRSLIDILSDLDAAASASARVPALTAELRAWHSAQHEALGQPAAPAAPAPGPSPAGPAASALPPASGSAVANVRALVAAGAAAPGARGADGRLVITQYGGPTDRTPDAATQAGMGNRGNRLTATSVALSPDLIAALALHGGETIAVTVDSRDYPLGTYDDTTGDHQHPNTIDTYDPTDALGQDTFLATVPAGRWTLRSSGGTQYAPAAAPAAAPTPSPAPSAGLTRAAAIARARSLVGQPITYELTKEPPGPLSDCSGFVDWCFGIDRNRTGENTDAMVADAHGPRKYYALVTGPARPGDAYVYPSPGPGHYGHTGLISEVDADGVPTMIIDCSSGNPQGRAIQEHGPGVFVENHAIIVRAVALVD